MPIVYPIFALVLLTLSVYPSILFSRIRSIRKGELTIDYLKLFQGETPPESVVKSARNVANLFEAPVLFYPACLISMLIGYESAWFLGLAWAYVAARTAHSIIHLTYNKISHRLWAFLLSQGILYLMWGLLFFESLLR
ncbi:MAPEG family protein [Methylomonas sp. MgM2]